MGSSRCYRNTEKGNGDHGEGGEEGREKEKKERGRGKRRETREMWEEEGGGKQAGLSESRREEKQLEQGSQALERRA